MGRGTKKILRAVVTISVAVFAATVAVAQTPNSGVTASLSFVSKLSLDTNPALEAASSGTVLEFSEDMAFNIRSATGGQFLEFSASGGLTFANTFGGGSSTSFDRPVVMLRYFRETADANFDTSANYWAGDITSAFDIDPTEAEFIIVDSGTLELSSAQAAYSWNMNSPLSFSVNTSWVNRDYQDTTDPSLLDTTTTILGGGVGLRISPTTQGSLNIGFREVSTSTGGPTSVASGLFGDFGVETRLANGTVFGSLEVDQSGAVNTTALTIGRTLEFSGGSLSASATAEKPSGSPVQLLGSAEFTRELPDGSISVGLSQSIGTNSLSEDIKLSSLGLGYERALNSSGGISLEIDLSRSEDGGAGAAATLNRAELSASYSQAINQDWDFSVGYTRRQIFGPATASANSDSVFLTLTRDIQFGF